MLFNKCVAICMILGNPISQISSVFYITFRAYWIIVFSYTFLHLRALLLTLTQTGLAVHLQDALLLTIVFSLVKIFSHGHLSDKVRLLDLVSQRSIGVLRMLWLRRVGFTTYYVSYFIPLLLLPWSTVIMLVRSTCPRIWFNINALNI